MTKHHETYLRLYDQIISGELPAGTRLPSEPDLARQLGINRKTLRTALERLEADGLLTRSARRGTCVCSFRKTDKQKVLLVCADAAEQTAYSPIPENLTGVMLRCQQLDLECVRISPTFSQDFSSLPGEYLGIIAINCFSAKDDVIVSCRKSGLPLVNLAGFESAVRDIGCAGVLPDRHAAWHAGLDHLLRRGHRRIGFPMLNNWESCRIRMDITQQEVEEHLRQFGAEFSPELVAFAPSQARPDIDEACLQLMRLPESRRPTALFCFSDTIAAAAYVGAARLGLRIPQDIAIMGFSGCYHGSLLQPSLSTVDFCYMEAASLAVDLLIHADEWKTLPTPPIIHSPYELLVRDSTRICRFFS